MTWGMLELVSDTDLLLAGARGDKTAFGALFARHERYLASVALRTTSDPEDAEDALQDAYVSIMLSRCREDEPTLQTLDPFLGRSVRTETTPDRQ